MFWSKTQLLRLLGPFLALLDPFLSLSGQFHQKIKIYAVAGSYLVKQLWNCWQAPKRIMPPGSRPAQTSLNLSCKVNLPTLVFQGTNCTAQNGKFTDSLWLWKAQLAAFLFIIMSPLWKLLRSRFLQNFWHYVTLIDHTRIINKRSQMWMKRLILDGSASFAL